MEHSGGVLGRVLGALIKTGLPLIRNVLKLLAKSVSVPLGLTAAASGTDGAIHKKMFASGVTLLLISNEKMNNIMKKIKSLEESGLLVKNVSKTIKNKAKKRKRGFLNMSWGTLGASLLGNLLAGKCTVIAGEATITAGHGFLIPPHPLTNFEIQKYYQNEPKFNGVYSRNILPKIKDEAYVINLDEFKSIGTHWKTLYVNGNNRWLFQYISITLLLNIFQKKLKNLFETNI